MYRVDAEKKVHFCDGMSRRDFLHAGALSFMGLTLPGFMHAKAHGLVNGAKEKNCIFLFLVGGPSQLDTFDMKPDAPAEIRGPYRPIRTNNPDIQISEIFPGLRGTPRSSTSCPGSTFRARAATTLDGLVG